jgi:hypothetical protein
VIDNLDKICKIMEEQLLSSVEYSADGVHLKINKAGFKTPEQPIENEIKGTSGEDDDELLFWSAVDE